MNWSDDGFSILWSRFTIESRYLLIPNMESNYQKEEFIARLKYP